MRETFLFYVKRDNVIKDALKRTLKPLFAPNKEVMVSTNCERFRRMGSSSIITCVG